MRRIAALTLSILALAMCSAPAVSLIDESSEIEPSGWYRSDWFGDFAPLRGGWLFHSAHGSLYTSGADTDSLWFYDLEIGWFWVDRSSHPNLYSSTAQGWLYFDPASGGDADRWFYSYESADWKTAAQLMGTTPGSSDAAFHAYLPSGDSSELIIVAATPSGSNLDLKIVEKKDIGTRGTTIAAHPDKPLLYISAGFSGGGTTVRLASSGTSVAELRPSNFDHPYAYLSLDRMSNFLIGTNYSEGAVDIYPLSTDGFPQARTAGLNEGRPFAHSAVPSPDNRFLYVPYVKGSNAVLQYRFDELTGSVTALSPTTTNVPDPSGPRHPAYHPSLPIVYFSTEQSPGLTAYAIDGDSGQLSLRQTVSALSSSDPSSGLTSSDIAITSDGKFLFTGIRGDSANFDAVARYRISSNGDVTHLGNTPTDKIPWAFALSPDSDHLLVTCTDGASLTAFRIGSNGSLTEVDKLSIPANITDLVTR